MRRINTDTLGAIACTLAFLVVGPAGATKPAPPKRAKAVGVSADAGASASKAPQPRGKSDIERFSDSALAGRLRALRGQRIALEAFARRDVGNRLHRIAYEKYRMAEELAAAEVAVMRVQKVREPDLKRRIRIGRDIAAVKRDIKALRAMTDLLRLYATR